MRDVSPLCFLKQQQMAYKRTDMISQCLKAIEEHNLVFQYELFSFVPFSQKTFHNHKLQDLPEIKSAFENSIIKQKVELRNSFRYSKSSAERIALYRLLATEHEFKRLVMNQIDHTSGGEKMTPLSFTVAEEGTQKRIENLISELNMN